MNQNTASATNSGSRVTLLILALGVFGVGVTEFVPVGLLPQIAAEFQVSIPVAGWVVSSYAVGVLVGAPLMTLLGVRIPRKTMLVLLMVVFTVGNLLSAFAPSFGLLLGGRVVTSFTHGAFFGIGSVVAAELAGPERRSKAVAVMFSGIALANLAGVPLATWLGHELGWRATFVVIAVLGVAMIAALAVFVPHLPTPAGVRLRREVTALGDAQVLLALLMTLLGFGGVFAALTYLTPIMTEVARFAETAMTPILIVLGLGMFIGNWFGGRMADRALMPTLIGSLAALVVALLAFVFTAHEPVLAVINVFLLGALGMATVPPLQTLVLHRAAAAPTLASAINIGAFNMGNAVAAWLAGVTIAAGLGLTSAGWVGAAMALASLVLAFVSLGLARRDARSAEAGSGAAAAEFADVAS
ncbi:MFS transporter [Microbacterium indicum]|uniref:MFS transporter n=1 Tax=Microbacterium indicum TaxID=358100 RepID=UPI0009FE904C|nr:MFS transporter [Microbacterium indicum]